MPATLPQSVTVYFVATNTHDIPAMLAAFSDGAVVKDEGQEHRGLKAIREWMKESIRKYDFRVEPTDVSETDGKTIVTSVLSGNFPGSPVRLRHTFTFDRQKIARLEIG